MKCELADQDGEDEDGRSRGTKMVGRTTGRDTGEKIGRGVLEGADTVLSLTYALKF